MARLQNAIVGTTAVLLVGSGVFTEVQSRPRHRVERAHLAAAGARATGAAQVRDLDTALPAGFVDVSRDSSGNEHSQGMVAVSPTNPAAAVTLFYDGRARDGVAASNSQDGGNTWSLSTLPTALPSRFGSSATLSDPTATVDSLGRFYVSGSGPDPTVVGQTLSTYVWRSDNGGSSFVLVTPTFTRVAQQSFDFLDHQSNWADSSGTTNNDYSSVSDIGTTNAQTGAQSQVIRFNQSSDGGVTLKYASNAALQISDKPANENDGSSTPDTRTDSHGKVYVDWTYENSNNQIFVYVDKANIPGGGTFGTDVQVAGPLSTDGNFFTAYLGDIRAGVFNTMAVDTSTAATNGNVYECWTDQVSSQGNSFKVLVARSQDGANTFSAPIRVDTSLDGTPANSDHQTVPTIAVNPNTGQVVVTYYSTHFNTPSRGGINSPLTASETASNTPLVDLLCSIGTPNASGGLDFSGPYRVTPSSIDVLAADNAGNLQFDPTLGDYCGLGFRAVSNGVNAVMPFVSVDSSHRIVEVAPLQFDGTASLTQVSGGNFEFKASATAPVAGLSASVNWGDGAFSSGIDLTHNYAAGSFTATAVVTDGSSSTRTLTFAVTSTGVFSSGAAGDSTTVTPNTLAALPSNNSGTGTTGTTSTTGTTGAGTTSTSGTTGTTTGGTSGTSSTTTGGSGTTTTTTGGTSTDATTGTAVSDSGGHSGCFIATAAYGSYWEPHVLTLRHFRDDDLLTNAPGRVFVANYYHYSPPVADWIRDHDWARAAVRAGLTPMVFGLEHTYLALLGMSLSVFGLALGWRRWRRQTP